jgi:hypothetical protein
MKLNLGYLNDTTGEIFDSKLFHPDSSEYLFIFKWTVIFEPSPIDEQYSKWFKKLI